MSGEINVISRTQVINIEPISGTISVINAGPPGPTLPGLSTGDGAPSAGAGVNGDYYFRRDTPSVANQRIYVKSAGSWIGIV